MWDFSQLRPFSGYYDGDGHSVSNLVIKADTQSLFNLTIKGAGLFGIVLGDLNATRAEASKMLDILMQRMDKFNNHLTESCYFLLLQVKQKP